MSEPEREYLTVSQAAMRLGISPRAVQKRCAKGILAARRISTPAGERWERLQAEAANRTASETSAALRETSKALTSESTFDAQNATRENASQATQTESCDQRGGRIFGHSARVRRRARHSFRLLII